MNLERYRLLSFMGNDDVFLEDDNMWLYIKFIGNCTSNMFFSFNTDLHGKILCSFHMAYLCLSNETFGVPNVR
jgi:hypothetical protein